jgi:hypothetical protein
VLVLRWKNDATGRLCWTAADPQELPGAQLRDGTINVTPDGAQLIIHAAFVAGLVPWEK